MGYIQDNLMPDENILLLAHVHSGVFLPSAISLVSGFPGCLRCKYKSCLVSVPARRDRLLLSIILGLEALVAILTTEFAVTDRRITAKWGFIRRRTLEILLPRVESVAVYQNILGRLLNFGTVTAIGTGGTQESFRAIADSTLARKKILQIVERYMQGFEHRPYRAGSED